MSPAITITFAIAGSFAWGKVNASGKLDMPGLTGRAVREKGWSRLLRHPGHVVETYRLRFLRSGINLARVLSLVDADGLRVSISTLSSPLFSRTEFGIRV